MEDAQLAEVQKKKIEQMQAAQARDEKIKGAMRQLLDDAAYQRLSVIKLSNEDLYYAIASTLMQYANSGRLKGKINETELRNVAASLSQKKETTITRISK